MVSLKSEGTSVSKYSACTSWGTTSMWRDNFLGLEKFQPGHSKPDFSNREPLMTKPELTASVIVLATSEALQRGGRTYRRAPSTLRSGRSQDQQVNSSERLESKRQLHAVHRGYARDTSHWLGFKCLAGLTGDWNFKMAALCTLP